MKSQQDTIAAIATAPAPAALGIVRISGSGAKSVLEKVVGRSTIRSRHVAFGRARDPETEEILDEVVYFFCEGPRTATGDDTAEIQGHGGPLVMSGILRAVLAAGTRTAEPGEFTYRAFANGKIDLTQAEAVMGLIGARSTRAARVALEQMKGALGERLSAHFTELSTVAAHIEAGLDFPDEDLPLALVSTLTERLDRLTGDLEALARTFTVGLRLADGARIAIVGPPNAGKSSLFNRLLDAERAIVDSEPGTTRDVVESGGEIAGIHVIFADTAGLREAGSRVEQVGIEKSRQAAESSDLNILVLDGADPLIGENCRRFVSLLGVNSADTVIALNKCDLPGYAGRGAASAVTVLPIVEVSAETGEGLDALVDKIGGMLSGEALQETTLLTTARQHLAVTETSGFVKRGAALLKAGGAPELVAAELKWARETLSGLLGKSATEEMLDRLFSAFCIGK